MKATTEDGQEIDIRQDVITNWKARLRGPVLAPGDAGYEDSRTVWNDDYRPTACSLATAMTVGGGRRGALGTR